MNGLVPTLEAMFPYINLGATKFEMGPARQIGKSVTFWRQYIRMMSTPRVRSIQHGSLTEICNIDEAGLEWGPDVQIQRTVVMPGTATGKSFCAIDVTNRTLRDLKRLNGETL